MGMSRKVDADGISIDTRNWRRQEQEIGEAWGPQPSGTDPGYMLGNPEEPEFDTSTDGSGGTLDHTSGGIGQHTVPRRRVSVNYPVPTGGTFVNPRVLPPVRSYRLQ